MDLLGGEYDRVFAEAREDGSFRNLAGEEPDDSYGNVADYADV